MNYKTVLVPLDAGPRCVARVAFAAQLASLHDSHLIGLAPTGLPDVIVTMNSAVPDSVEYIQLSAKFLRERAEVAARTFEQAVRAAGVASSESRVVEAEPIDAVVRLGRCCDLIVVGQTDRQTNVDGVARDFPQEVVLHTGTPVLMVPYVGEFGAAAGCVLVAWKETREAARALRDALPMLRRARQVVLVEIVEEGDEAAGAESSLEDARAWLSRHGIAAEARRQTRAIGAGDALLSYAADVSADLLVMGAYGHSRLREWVLGGATRHLLDHMTVPTLMSH
ncbi:MAG: universal stress protein [Caldimonas sp.]